MIDQLRSFRILDWFGLGNAFVPGQKGHFNRQADISRLETVICLESVLHSCYQVLAGLVHNQTFRRTCKQFEQHAEYHQEELKNIFPLPHESERIIQRDVQKYLLQLDPPNLFLREVLDLTTGLIAYKIDIYKYLLRTYREHQGLINRFLDESIEEMDFLRKESKIYKNSVEKETSLYWASNTSLLNA